MSGLPHHAHMMESLWPREAFACSAIFTTNTLNFDDCVTFSLSPLDFYYLITLILSTLVLDKHDRPLSDTPGETFYGSPPRTGFRVSPALLCASGYISISGLSRHRGQPNLPNPHSSPSSHHDLSLANSRHSLRPGVHSRPCRSPAPPTPPPRPTTTPPWPLAQPPSSTAKLSTTPAGDADTHHISPPRGPSTERMSKRW